MFQKLKCSDFLLKILLLLLITSCSHTVEEISQIGKVPHMTSSDIMSQTYEEKNNRNSNNNHYQEINDYKNMKNEYFHSKKNKKQKNSLWQSGSREFFKDKKARGVGDILKIKIKISDKATFDNKTTTNRSSNEDFGLTGLFGLQNKIPDVIDAPKSEPLVGTTAGNNRQGTGKINRKEDIETEIAATVIRVFPNGNLLIKGTQEVRVNYEVRELLIEGIVRADDISVDNTVSSDQIAEARISYGGRGHLSKVQQPRYGAQFIDSILPW